MFGKSHNAITLAYDFRVMLLEWEPPKAELAVPYTPSHMWQLITVWLASDVAK